MNITDFTVMSRQEIREHLNSVIGDDYLTDEICEELLILVEDLTDVTDDEFWGITKRVFND